MRKTALRKQRSNSITHERKRLEWRPAQMRNNYLKPTYFRLREQLKYLGTTVGVSDF